MEKMQDTVPSLALAAAGLFKLGHLSYKNNKTGMHKQGAALFLAAAPPRVLGLPDDAKAQGASARAINRAGAGLQQRADKQEGSVVAKSIAPGDE